ncbi:MAG: SH3 domain-containing protein [Pseudomonadota bacterium]
MPPRSSWLLIGLVCFTFTAATAAQVVAEGAFLRGGPGTDQPVVAQLQKGDELHLVEQKGDWFLAETDDNHVGWVNTSVLKNIEPIKSETASASPAAGSASAPVNPASAPPADASTKALSSPAGAPAGTPSKPVEPASSTPLPPSPALTNAPTAQPTPAPEILPGADEERLARGEYKGEFGEISLAVRPGAAWKRSGPATIGKHGFVIGAHVAYVPSKVFGVSIPYTFLRYGPGKSFQSVGGGPYFRLLNMHYLRASMDGNALYVRGLKANHFGWSAGGDVTIGNRKAKLRPFFGPFVRYERYSLPGRDLGSLFVGASLTLTNLTDIN